MRYLKQIEYPILVAMIFSLIRAFIHSLISEQDRFSRLYCLVYKERLDYINNLENWIFMVGMIILIPTFTYKLINKEWKDVSWLLLFALFINPLDFLYLLFQINNNQNRKPNFCISKAPIKYATAGEKK